MEKTEIELQKYIKALSMALAVMKWMENNGIPGHMTDELRDTKKKIDKVLSE